MRRWHQVPTAGAGAAVFEAARRTSRPFIPLPVPEGRISTGEMQPALEALLGEGAIRAVSRHAQPPVQEEYQLGGGLPPMATAGSESAALRATCGPTGSTATSAWMIGSACCRSWARTTRAARKCWQWSMAYRESEARLAGGHRAPGEKGLTIPPKLAIGDGARSGRHWPRNGPKRLNIVAGCTRRPTC